MGDLGDKTAFGNGKCSGVQDTSEDVQGRGSSLAQLGDRENLRMGKDE